MHFHPQSEPTRQLVQYERQNVVNVPSMLSVPEESGSGALGLAEYWYVVSKYRRIIIAMAFAMMAIAIVASFLMKPVYTASARLEVEPETPILQSFTDIYQRADVDDPFIQTQIQVLKGPTLTWQTIEQLDISRDLGVLHPEELTKTGIEGHKIELINAFQGHLKVESLPKTRLLSIGFESTDPQLAARVANGLANAYLDYNFRQKYEAIRRSGWLEQQVNELREKVEESQQALVSYEQKYHITATGDKQDVLMQMLSDLTHDLSAARSERIQKEALVNQVTQDRSQMAYVVNDDLLQRLQGGLADLKGQYASTVAQYGPNFPRAARLQLQINEQQGQIEQEQNRIIERIRNDYDAAHDREKLAMQAVANQKTEVGNLNQLLVQDNLLRHEFETNEQLYQSMLGRLKDATVSAGLRSTSIHLVDSALPPVLPTRPRKLLYAAVALWAGVVLGIMVAFAKDKIDPSLKTVEEAEALVLSPALGVLPFERNATQKKGTRLKKTGSYQLAMSLSRHPHSSLSEAFRALGTAVSISPNSMRSLLVTSAQNGEGKTIIAVNLGQVLAQRRGPVLLVDCDLRRNGIAGALGLKNDKGLSTILSGKHTFSESVQTYSYLPNLSVLTSGPVPSNPAELLASEEMEGLLKEMRKQFACVILDSPPMLAVTDATILSTLVDGVLLVAASGSTPRAALLRTRRMLANAGAHVVGIAMNKLDPRLHKYHSYGYPYTIDSNPQDAFAKVG